MSLIKIRKVISGVFFMLFVFLFLGPERLSLFLSDVLLPVQFTPALVRIIAQPDVLFAAGLIVIILMTLIFGRVYCSFICPLGTLQDLLIRGLRRMDRRASYSFSKPLNALRYTLPALTAGAVFIGSLSLVSLLDPYSLTGRIFAYFLQPVLTWIYNVGILAFKPFDIYLYPKQMAFIPLSLLALTTCFVLMIVILCRKHGRLYCNTICPVGAFLGLLSRFSFFQFTLNEKSCSECVRCENICKAECIDPQTVSIDMSRCVGCFNCLAACPGGAISYRPRQQRSRRGVWSPARRGFVIGSVAAAVAVFLAFNPRLRELLAAPARQTDLPVTPPGSVSVARFTNACTSCSLCVSICPTRVLTPSFTDFGISGLLQPRLNYENSYCDYECNACGKACPTGAILEMPLEEKKLTQIGEAELVKDICVVFVNHENCGACGEVCPTHAIRFTERENILYPEIDSQYCIGCGACQLACPTSPRSIIVHANPVHKKAEKYIRPESAGQAPETPDKDFPF